MNDEEKLQFNNLKEKVDNLESLFYKNNFSALQVFDKKVQMKSGLVYNVLTARPTYTGENGETVLVDDSSTVRKVCSYLNGTWACQDYEITQATGFLSNIVEDTTPQLGGDLDTNDKVITSEGGLITKYTLTKTLSDNVDTDILRIQITDEGAAYIRVNYVIAISPNSTHGGMVSGGVYQVVYTGDTTSLAASNETGTTALIEAETGETIATTWSNYATSYHTITLKVLADNTANVNNYLTASIEILSTVPVNYTAL